MIPRRVSIAGLLGFVAVVAIALAALMRASPLWAIAMEVLVWGLLLTAILGAVLGRGRRRAYWLGFAVFGWGFLILLLLWGADFDETSPRWVATRYLLDFAARFSPSDPKGTIDYPFYHYGSHASELHEQSIAKIGRCLLALAVAPIGGLIARIMAAWVDSEDRDGRRA